MHYVEAKGLLSSLNGMNIYRGCSHGCIYCDARSNCYGFTHQFEDIEVKGNAPELLEAALKSKRKKCMIGTGAMSDPYMHIEEKLGLTRQCLEIIDRYEFGLAIQTKSNRILRDLDLLKSINEKAKCVVQMTLTTYDEELCKLVEPNVCTTKERFETLKVLRDYGIPTIVWMTPLLPFINDTKENIDGILSYCIEAEVKGIITFGLGLTLRDGDREYYYAALDKHFPGIKDKYISKYRNSYELPIPRERELYHYFERVCKQNGIISDTEECFKYMRDLPEKFEQLSLF